MFTLIITLLWRSLFLYLDSNSSPWFWNVMVTLQTDWLNFHLHVDKICLQINSTHLLTLSMDWFLYDNSLCHERVKLKRFLGNEERKVLISNFVPWNFNCCPLVWMLTNAKSVHKTEAIQERALRFILKDYGSSYEDLLKKSGNPSMNLGRTWSLCIKTYKTINNLHPEFMKHLFKVHKTNRAQKKTIQAKFRNPKI